MRKLIFREDYTVYMYCSQVCSTEESEFPAAIQYQMRTDRWGSFWLWIPGHLLPVLYLSQGRHSKPTPFHCLVLFKPRLLTQRRLKPLVYLILFSPKGRFWGSTVIFFSLNSGSQKRPCKKTQSLCFSFLLLSWTLIPQQSVRYLTAFWWIILNEF
jgi:hypothetical protein